MSNKINAEFGGSGNTGWNLNRRQLLQGSFLASGMLLAGFDEARWPLLLARQHQTPPAGGKLLGTVPFTGEARVPMGEAMGSELDGRLYTDLSELRAEKSVTATEEFYIRTRVSNLLDTTKPWSLRVGGGLVQSFELSMEELRRMAKPMGLHLMECAGNARSVHFGMMSVADWAGVPLSGILERAKAKPNASRVLISGFDTYAAASTTSVPGASWIFTADDLKKAGAFLATEMNGSALTKDHGAPVRLVVPGWYGCTCIKWVSEIAFTQDDVAATSQMKEYAARTMQKGVPKLAREYQPAAIEQAAMPVRIEKWVVDEIRYRVIGILWGGSAPVKKLQIRCNPEEDYVDVEQVDHKSNDPWNFWSHTWKPKESGSYLIRLRIAEPIVAARRLDSGFYTRSVDILET